MVQFYLILIAVASFAATKACCFSLLISLLLKNTQKKEAFAKGRFSFACVFFSIFISVFTVGIIFFDIIEYIKSFSMLKCIYFVFFAFIIFLIIFFYKKVLPIVFILYVIYVSVFLIILTKNFGKQYETINLVIFENKVEIDGKTFFCNDGKKVNFLVFEKITLPEFLLLPTRKNWKQLAGISMTEESVEKSSQKKINFFLEIDVVPLPNVDFYPAEYRLSFKNELNMQVPVFEKLL